MQASRDGLKVVREPRRLASIVTAIGTAWTSRRAEKSKTRKARLLTPVGHADGGSWFLLQIEQNKNRALYYNKRNQLW